MLVLAITIEMLISDDPWATATILIPFLPNTENSFPAIPDDFRIPSPTVAIIDNSRSMLMLSTWPLAISTANSSSRIAFTRSAARGSMAKQMECSDEACEIRITLIRCRANTPNNLADTPTTPIMPDPCTLTNAMSSMLEIPVMVYCRRSAVRLTSVPAWVGLNVFSTRIGILRAKAGCKLGG